MSAPPPLDRSGRAPLVPPGPFAPPVPTPGTAAEVSSRFSFLPEEPMKRPPPDPAARVYTSTERTQSALVAREDALRHPAPFGERVVGDVKDGTVIGGSIIARAASASAMRLKAGTAAAAIASARTVRAICVFPFVVALRTMLLAANAARAGGRAVALVGRAGWHMATAVTHAVLQSVAAVYTFTVALVRRSMLLAARAARAVGGAVVSGGRAGWHIATSATHAASRSIAAVYTFTVAFVRRSMLFAAHAARAVAGAVVSGGRAGWPMATAATHAVSRSIAHAYTYTAALVRRSMLFAAHAARAVGGAVVSGGRVGWHVTARIVKGVLLALLAIGLAFAAIVVGIVTAARTGIVLLSRATGAGSRQLWEATRVASRSGAAASRRASVVAGKALASAGAMSSDAAIRASAASRDLLSRSAGTVSQVGVRVRWQAPLKRPNISAVAGEFTHQLVRSVRQIPPRQAVAGLALTVALIAAVYGSPRRERGVADGTTAAPQPSASREPALASVAPASVAETAALIRSLKEQPAAPPVPSPKPRARPSAPPAAATADADRAADVRRGQAMGGTLTIASAPKGAKVTIDGIPRGHSPLSVSDLRAGNRIVRLELDGYQRWSWAVYVSASRPTRLNVSLVRDSGQPRSSAVTNTAAAAK
jgi:hypothetical protein